MHSIIESLRVFVAPLIFISSFIYFCYLGISEEWEWWPFIAIGLEILVIILVIILYFIGFDSDNFSYIHLFKRIGIMVFFTTFFAFFIGFHSLWLPPAFILIWIFFPNDPKDRSEESDY